MSIYRKRLQSYTIVPDELYVKRSADLQLHGVVESMGRPGYVLVARQMGKTNLLLNAKRELGQGEDIFVYIDLSNPYPSLNEFFRHVVDTAIDSEPERLWSALEEVRASRAANRGLPAHKEHEIELRILLRATTGKIVICLDEVDALTKSSYSDSVFSQIRSIYFASRSNFREFNRLTYILSGVAEPTELIKNKAISPFNIGEKIYLDDFTYSEYLTFLEKAGLAFNESTVERIFFWTAGSPRLCWDLCAALEDLFLKGIQIEVDEVDRTVQKLYLSTYDMAPVDHIRQLVSEDKEIRVAVLNIYQKKFSLITDSVRTKLYLKGIVKADFSSREISIKNKIIEESLSVEWLKNLEDNRLPILSRANAKFAEQDYVGALVLYAEAVEDDTSNVDKTLVYHSMGECCFMLGDYNGVINYLKRDPIKKSQLAVMFFRQHLWLGMAYFRTGNIDESIDALNIIINSDFPEGYPAEYYDALISRCTPYLERFEEYAEEIISDCSRVIGWLETADLHVDRRDRISCAAYITKSDALIKLGRKTEAAELLNKGLEVVSVDSKPTLIIKLIDALSGHDREILMSRALDLIVSNQVSFTASQSHAQFRFGEAIFSELLVRFFSSSNSAVIDKIFEVLENGRFDRDLISGVLNQATILALHSRVKNVIKHIMRMLLKLHNRNEIANEIKALGYYLVVMDGDESSFDIFEEFLLAFDASASADINEYDLVTLYVLTGTYLKIGKNAVAERVIESALRRRNELILSPNLEVVKSVHIIDFLNLGYIAGRKSRAVVERMARQLREAIPDDMDPPKLFEGNFFVRMRSELDEVLATSKPTPVRMGKIGRNEMITCQYKDGTIRRQKFKILQNDIANGKCDIIEEKPSAS